MEHDWLSPGGRWYDSEPFFTSALRRCWVTLHSRVEASVIQNKFRLRGMETQLLFVEGGIRNKEKQK